MSQLIQSVIGDKVEPFRAMNVVASASKLIEQGHDVVMMCVGQPSAPAPLPARQAAQIAIEKGRIGYTDAAGIKPLKQRIAKHYKQKYDVEVSPDRIVVTTGSSAGFTLAFLSTLQAGARVAIPTPGYPAYRNILRALNMEPVAVETNAESGWVLTPQLLAEAHAKAPLDCLLIANPNNPNGTMIEPEAFVELQKTCHELGIKFISDEIYHGLVYGMGEQTALSYSDDAIIINSFSKYYCMTGWRIGWMIVPENLISTIDRLQQNLFICAPEISQIAALHAFDGTQELELVKKGYEKNKALFLSQLPKMGLNEIMPVDGAFYCYANAGNLSQNTEQLCADILNQEKVAITPGTDFDTNRGKQWLRFSFAGSHDDLQKGLERLGNFMSAI